MSMNVQQALNAYILAHPNADPEVLVSVGNQLNDLTDYNADTIKAIKAVLAVTSDYISLRDVSSLLSDIADQNKETIEAVKAVLAWTDDYKRVYVEAHGIGCECKKCAAESDKIMI